MWLTAKSIRLYDSFKEEATAVNAKNHKKQQSKLYHAGLADIEDHAYEFIPPGDYSPVDDEEDLEPAPKTPAAKTPKSQQKRKANDEKSAEDNTPANKSGKKKKVEPAATTTTPAAKTQQPVDKLMALRHKLQKIFLQDAIKWTEMARVDPAMKEIEAFEVDGEMLKLTKIAKVLKKIMGLQMGDQEPPRLKERCLACLNSWQKWIGGGVRQEGPASDAKPKSPVKAKSPTKAKSPAKEEEKETVDAPEKKEETAKADTEQQEDTKEKKKEETKEEEAN